MFLDFAHLMKSATIREVTGKLHLDDDVKFEIQPLAVILFGIAFRHTFHFQALIETFMGLAAKFAGFIKSFIAGAEVGQDRWVDPWPMGAAPGNLNGVFKGFRQIFEQGDHLLGRFEIVLRRQAAAVRCADHIAMGDTDQGVMGFIIVRIGEIGFVGRHQGQFQIIGQLHKIRLDDAFMLQSVALQFDIETITKDLFQMFKPAPCPVMLTIDQSLIDCPVRATGQANQPFTVCGQCFNVTCGSSELSVSRKALLDRRRRLA